MKIVEGIRKDSKVWQKDVRGKRPKKCGHVLLRGEQEKKPLNR